jgi:hypothetical protein
MLSFALEEFILEKPKEAGQLKVSFDTSVLLRLIICVKR